MDFFYIKQLAESDSNVKAGSLVLFRTKKTSYFYYIKSKTSKRENILGTRKEKANKQTNRRGEKKDEGKKQKKKRPSDFRMTLGKTQTAHSRIAESHTPYVTRQLL